MMDFLDIYEKNVKPQLQPVVVEEQQKDETELFKVEDKKEEPKPPTFSDFDENALIEKISAKILESLNIQQQNKEELNE